MTPSGIDGVAARLAQSATAWRNVPPPLRGELALRFRMKLRAAKDDLGRRVPLENGKILQEGLGEVQEMIDICDFAVGLSRQRGGVEAIGEDAADCAGLPTAWKAYMRRATNTINDSDELPLAQGIHFDAC